MWTVGGGTNYSTHWTQVTSVNEEWTQTVFDFEPQTAPTSTTAYTFEIQLGTVFENTVIPICFSADSLNSSVSITTGKHLQDIFNGSGDTDTTTSLVNNVTYYLRPQVSGNYYKLKFTLKPNVSGNANDSFVTKFTITMWTPRKFKTKTGGGALTYVPDVYAGAVANKVKELSNIATFTNSETSTTTEYSLFNYSYSPNDDEIIENPLSSESFFNVNHIRNKYTIAQIDTKNININVMKQSRK